MLYPPRPATAGPTTPEPTTPSMSVRADVRGPRSGGSTPRVGTEDAGERLPRVRRDRVDDVLDLHKMTEIGVPGGTHGMVAGG